MVPKIVRHHVSESFTSAPSRLTVVCAFFLLQLAPQVPRADEFLSHVKAITQQFVDQLGTCDECVWCHVHVRSWCVYMCLQ